jgi:aspartate-semialdehyde dehydrogenase
MTSFDPAGHRVAVIGATGAVGTEMVKVLHDRRYPVKELRLLASARSADRRIATPFGDIAVQPFSLDATAGCDVVLMAVSGEFSKEWAQRIATQ